MPSLHFTRARVYARAAAGVFLAAAACAGAADAQPQASPAGRTASSFTVFLRSVPIGSEQIRVQRTDAGWIITGSGRIGPPVDIVTRKVEIRYTPDWRPLALTVDATTRGQPTTLQVTVNGTTARSEITTNGVPSEKTDTIDPAAVLLPTPFFAPYEAVAAQLQNAPPGASIPVYIAPTGSLTITVGESTPERIQTSTQIIQAQRTRVTLAQPGLPLDAEIWTDSSGRLLRVSIPAQTLEVVREDIASVSARRVTVSREGDEQVRVPANGFLLAGTLSKPAKGSGRRPAVVLASGAAPADRDELAFGIPIFGHLANALADAGFIVLRYDKRGTGQSGGRLESATVSDYADDLRAAVRFMSGRRDVDRDRIAVIGYAEGGWFALVTAEREDRVAAVVLLATPGINGAELNLARVQRTLERSPRSDTEKASTLALQKQVQEAAITGKGWESVPPAMRQQADTPWFRSFLTFDPAGVIEDVDQPILIVQPLLDAEVLPSNADRLEQLARERKRQTDAVRLPGINHLLATARTGEVDEYGTLQEKRVSPAVPEAIAAWLQKTFAAQK